MLMSFTVRKKCAHSPKAVHLPTYTIARLSQSDHTYHPLSVTYTLILSHIHNLHAHTDSLNNFIAHSSRLL